MFCNQCGNPVKPNERFCSKCGTANASLQAGNYVGYANYNNSGSSNKYDLFLKKLKNTRIAVYIGAVGAVLAPFFSALSLFIINESLDYEDRLEQQSFTESENTFYLIIFALITVFFIIQGIYFVIKGSKLSKVIDAVALHKSPIDIDMLFLKVGKIGAILLLIYYIFTGISSFFFSLIVYLPIIIPCIMIINLNKFYKKEICAQP